MSDTNALNIELNFKLYQHLMDIYKISETNDYAPPYVFTLSATNDMNYDEYFSISSRSVSYINEQALMQIIFSKYINDKTQTIAHQTYIDYILHYDKNYPNAYLDPDRQYILTVYYEDNLQNIVLGPDERENKKRKYPYTNRNIIDFDISSYASNNIRHYLFYIDIISQIYGYAYERKKNKQVFPVGPIKIKGRYFINVQNQILNLRDSAMDMTLELTIEGINNNIIDVQLLSNLPTPFNIFKEDVLRHLRYLSGEDVRLTGLSFLKTVEYFYKFCRLRLMFIIANSIKLMLRDSVAFVNTFILEEALAVFTNFREKLNVEIILNEDFKMTKNMLYNKSIIDTSTRLGDINNQLISDKDRIENNKTLLDYIDQQYSVTYDIHLTATIALFYVILSSIIIFAININVKTKAFISMVSSVILVALTIVLHVIATDKGGEKIIEKFGDDPVRFPREILKGNQSRYSDGTLVKVKSSSGNDCLFTIFNNAICSRQPCASYGWTSQTNGLKWIAINLDEYITVDRFEILSMNPSQPIFAKLYASSSSTAYTYPTILNNSVISSNWTLLRESSITYGSPSTTNSCGSTGLIRSEPISVTTAISYPIYMLVTSNTQPSQATYVKYWNIYGNKTVKTIKLVSETLPEGMTDFTPLALPSDYDDERLVSWDLKLTTADNVRKCVNLSIGTYCFNNTKEVTFTEQTLLLDPYGSQYITGFVDVGNPQLSNLRYELTIRYYAKVVDGDQSYQISLLNTLSSDITSIETEKSRLEGQLRATSNILNTSNARIASYLENYERDRAYSNAFHTYRSQQTLYSQLNSRLNASNQLLSSLAESSNEINANIANIHRDLLNELDNYQISSNTFARLNSAYNTLSSTTTTSITYFREFMTASERSVADTIFSKIQSRKFEEISADMNKLLKVADRGLLETSCNIVYEEARIRSESASKSAELSTKNANAKFLNSEAKSMEDRNAQIQTSIEAANSLKSEFNTQYRNEMSRRDSTSNLWEVARSNRQAAESQAAMQLSEYNIRYNTGYASLNEVNDVLTNKIKTESSLEASAIQEYEDLAYQERIENIKLRTANAAISFYTALADHTENTISFYNQVIDNYNTELSGYQKDREASNIVLTEQRSISERRIAEAQAQYDITDRDTLQEIIALKDSNNAILRDIALTRKAEADKYKEHLQKSKERQSKQEYYDDLIRQLETEKNERDYYKTIRDAVKDDVDPSMIIKDIDAMFLYSITDSINGINYDLISPNIAKEYHHYNEYKRSVKLSALKSEFDLNNKILQIRNMEARTVLFLNLSIIISICMSIYYYISYEIAGIIALILIIISVIIFAVQNKGPVRSQARNYYWG